MATAEEDSCEMADIGKLTLSSPRSGEATDGATALLGTSTIPEDNPGPPPPGTPEGGPSPPAVENDSGIDTALLDALGCSKRRQLVLEFEADVDTFVQDPLQTTLLFSLNLTGYQRLLAHRVAQHYGLITKTVDTGEHLGKIAATKTGNEHIPKVTLSSVPLVGTPGSEGSSSAAAPKVLSRAPRRSGSLLAQGLTFSMAGAQSAVSMRPLQERRRTYSEARDRLLEGGEPTRVPGRGFGRGNPSASSSVIGRSRGSGGRGRGSFRGQEDDVRDPDYERYQPHGGAQYGGPQRHAPYGPPRPYGPEVVMHPSGMMMSPDGHYMQPAVMGGYGAMPYMPVHDPAMQQMQGVPPMPGGPGMPGVPMYGGTQGQPFGPYPPPYWNMPMQSGQEGVMMGMMQHSFPVYGQYPQYNMPYAMGPVNPQGRPQGRGAGSNGAPRRTSSSAGQGNSGPPNPTPRPPAYASSGPPGAHMQMRPYVNPGAGASRPQRTTSGPMNTSVGSSARMQANTYPSVGMGPGQMRPPPITLPRPSAFAPGASPAARAAPD